MKILQDEQEGNFAIGMVVFFIAGVQRISNFVLVSLSITLKVFLYHNFINFSYNRFILIDAF